MFLRAENTDRLQTTLHGYHRRIKPYVTEAFKLGYIEENPYLKFKDVAGKSKDRKPLTSAELDKLRSVDLPKKLSRVRDLFIFCCYAGIVDKKRRKEKEGNRLIVRNVCPFLSLSAE